VARLKEYYEKRLILFPRRAGKTKKGDASAEDVKAAKSGEGVLKRVTHALTISNEYEIAEGNVKDYPSEENAYKKLRTARSDARLVGVRSKRAAAKAEEAANAKK
jgi:large subunit ribosomal protein L13e